MQIEAVKKILILGAGTMGHQIGFLCAMHGYDVAVYDVSREMLDGTAARVHRLAEKMIHLKRLAPDLKDDVLNRMHYTTDKAVAAAEADIVSESIPEDLEMKRAVFKSFNALCPERTIFTTNTSTLKPSMFAADSGRPEKLLAFHFHDILQTNVVDIMPHPGTAKETVALVRAFAEKLGQIVVLLARENIGYVFNAMLSDWLRSALTLASNEVASVEDIDRAWMGVMHTHTGPFGIMDSIGLDTVWKVTDNFAKLKTDMPQLAKNAAFIKGYVDAGKLGTKTKEGFYKYPQPRFLEKDFVA